MHYKSMDASVIARTCKHFMYPLSCSLETPSGLAMLQREADLHYGGNVALAQAALIDLFCARAKQKSSFLQPHSRVYERKLSEGDANAPHTSTATESSGKFFFFEKYSKESTAQHTEFSSI